MNEPDGAARDDDGRPTLELSSEVEAATSDLEYVSVALERWARLVLLFTIANFVIVVLTGIRGGNAFTSVRPAVGCGISGGVTALVLVALAIFDRMRRRGDAIYDEISEELQAELRQQVAAEAKKLSATRPPLRVRLALRQFGASSTLPLTPRHTGPMFYAIVNVLLTLFSLLALAGSAA